MIGLRCHQDLLHHHCCYLTYNQHVLYVLQNKYPNSLAEGINAEVGVVPCSVTLAAHVAVLSFPDYMGLRLTL